MKEAPLTKDPETGEAVRRVISGGLGYMSKFNAPKHADMQREMGSGSGSCGCPASPDDDPVVWMTVNVSDVVSCASNVSPKVRRGGHVAWSMETH